MVLQQESSNSMAYILIITISAVLLLGAETESITEEVKKDSSPVEIKAKRLKIENQYKKATFSDDVVATKSDMKMTCNELIAYYNESGNIDRFECIGNVTLVKGEKRATSEKAVYENLRSLVTMTGNPSYSDKDNRFWGDVVEYDLNKDEVNVKNIKAIIKIKDKQEKR